MTLAAQAEYLEGHADVDLESLAWTLQARRSALPIKTWISASSSRDLRDRIRGKLQEARDDAAKAVGVRSVAGPHRILGVFTGQGAQ